METGLLGTFSAGEIATFDRWIVYASNFRVLFANQDTMPPDLYDAYVRYKDHRGNMDQILIFNPQADVSHRQVPMEEAAREFETLSGFQAERLYEYMRTYGEMGSQGVIDLATRFGKRVDGVLKS